MRAENAILIRAPLDEIDALAAAVERWPALLPHDRDGRVRARRLEMAARRDGIPVRWIARPERQLGVAVTDAFGFGAVNASLVVRRWDD